MVLILQILRAASGALPGSDLAIGPVPLVLALKAGFDTASLLAALPAYRHVVQVLARTVLGAWLATPAAASHQDARLQTARGMTLFLYTCLAYGLGVRGGEPVVAVLTPARWPMAALGWAGLALALLAIVRTLKAIHPLLDAVGHAVAGRGPAPGESAAIKCPACGVLDDADSRFCRFCGRALRDEPAPEPPAPATPCTRCGAAITPPARFCRQCGKPA